MAAGEALGMTIGKSVNVVDTAVGSVGFLFSASHCHVSDSRLDTERCGIEDREPRQVISTDQQEDLGAAREVPRWVLETNLKK